MDDKKKNKCTAIVEHGNINLIISKEDEAYQDFAKVLNLIGADGVMCWYGDVRNEEGKEQSGLIITNNSSVARLHKRTKPIPQKSTKKGFIYKLRRKHLAKKIFLALLANPERYKYLTDLYNSDYSHKDLNEKNVKKAYYLADAFLEHKNAKKANGKRTR